MTAERELVLMLRRLQWAGTSFSHGGGRCPVCYGEEAQAFPDQQIGGHQRDCALAQLLVRYDGRFRTRQENAA